MSDSTLPPPAELVEHLNHSDCVLFVGDALDEAGSQSARLAAALVDACGGHCQFCQSSGKCTQPHNCVVPLTRAAQLYESRNSRHALVDFVSRHIDNFSPTPLHHALVSLPVRVIVTTAYDNRLETALHEAARPYRSVVHDVDIPFDDPHTVQLIRLHGTINRPDSLVLTDNDAADLFSHLNPVTRIILQAHLASKTLLFVGYDLGDPYFRMLYRQVTAPIARYQRPAYALQWPPDALAAESWQGQITFIDAVPLSFLAQLARAVQIKVVPPKQLPLPPGPYKFLDYYTEQDAAIFFGRDLEADLLLSTVLAHKLSVFYGRSGTGKTSMLLARLAPALEEAGYQVAYARMLGDPASEVKAAVRKLLDQAAYDDHNRSLRDALADALPPAGRLVIILDQFEEFFVRQGESVRKAFAQELADCLWPTTKQPATSSQLPDIRFVLSQRDDYLGTLDELCNILPHDVFAHRYKLENLTREKALLAILKPAEAFGLPIEESLRERLIADLEDLGLEPASLQIVLYRLYRDAVEQKLWSPRDKRGAGLTLARYQALGGTKGILAGYLDQVLDELPTVEQQQGAKAILKSMVTAQQTKAAVIGREIEHGDLVAKAGLAKAQVDELLAYLREKRVMRKFGDEDRYELAHEVMVQKVWAWVSDEELRVMEIRDMLRRAMGDWHKFGHLLAKEKLELLQSCCDALALGEDEEELIFRSALLAGYKVPYWRGRAPAVVGKVEGELFGGLEAQDPAQAAQAVSGLAALASPEIVGRLAEMVEAEFGGKHVVWVNYKGKKYELSRTILNLATLRQRRAVLALARMVSPGTAQALAEATEALGRWTPMGMILVPAGPFTMGGTGLGDEGPVHEVWVESFWIDRYPVTNAQWAAFVESGAWKQRQLWTEAGWVWIQMGGSPGKHDEGKSDHPVVNVTWYESVAFARWAGKGLLSEAEWEKAASWVASSPQGEEGWGEGGVQQPSGRKRMYPWGDKFDRSKCNTDESGIGGTTPAGKYSPQGDSPYGVADMAGNVWEWTASLYRPYPCRPDDQRDDAEAAGARIVRGGSWYVGSDRARCTHRNYFTPDFAYDYYGLRCCSSGRSLTMLNAGC